MTHGDVYDLSVIDEPSRYGASVTIHPSQEPGMLVVTDSRLCFIRVHNGKTFIARVLYHSEILSCTATSRMGSGALDLNTLRGEFHFTGEASALQRIADQLSIQPEADASSSTWGDSNRSTSTNTSENTANEPNWRYAESVYRPPANGSPTFKLTDEVKQIGLGFLLLIAGVAINSGCCNPNLHRGTILQWRRIRDYRRCTRRGDRRG